MRSTVFSGSQSFPTLPAAGHVSNMQEARRYTTIHHGARLGPARASWHVLWASKKAARAWVFFKGLRSATPSRAERWKPTISATFAICCQGSTAVLLHARLISYLYTSWTYQGVPRSSRLALPRSVFYEFGRVFSTRCFIMHQQMESLPEFFVIFSPRDTYRMTDRTIPKRYKSDDNFSERKKGFQAGFPFGRTCGSIQTRGQNFRSNSQNRGLQKLCLSQYYLLLVLNRFVMCLDWWLIW